MKNRLIFVIGFVVLIAGRAFAIDDLRSRIAVLPMVNMTQEARYDAICKTVTETVALVFRLMGKYFVVESDEYPSLLTVDVSSNDTLESFAEGARFDEVLMGKAARDESGVLTFQLSLFSRSQGKVQYEAEATARSILEVFDAADEITVGLLSQVSDIHIGFGAIEVSAAAGAGSYTVYLNDAKIKNPKSMLAKVLNGTYTISIRQNRLLGDTEIFRKSIQVFEDETTKVSFSIPAATPQETAYLQSQKQALLSTSADHVDELLKGIADFQKATSLIDYDASLSALQASALSDAGAKALDILRASTTSTDALYYGSAPSFTTAQSRYEELERLVSDSYSFQLLEPGTQSAFTVPSQIRIAPDGSVLVLDSGTKPQIRIAADGATLSATLPITDAPSESEQICASFDGSSRIYYLVPGQAAIHELDKSLKSIAELTLPNGESVKTGTQLAVSDDGVIYLLGSSQLMVFEPGGQRVSEVEQSLQAGLKSASIGSIDDAFFDHNGLLSVLDTQNGQILRFDASGNLRSAVHLPGMEPGCAAAVDALGNIYITMISESRVAKYNARGQLISRTGKYGAGPGDFSAPGGIAISSRGTLYVSDTYNNRVQIMTPTSTPILLPELANYGFTLAQRAVAAEKAQNRIEVAKATIQRRNALVPLLEGAGTLVVGAGLVGLGAYFDSVAQDNYTAYLAAVDPVQVGALHDTVASNAIFSSLSTFGSQLSLLGATALMTAALLDGITNATAIQDTVSQIQAIRMDAEYELDRTRYRSLATAESIGFWTGVLPPLLGATSLFTLLEVPLSTGYLPQIIAGATVLVPPLFSNLYAGRLDTGLLVSGIVADVLTAASVTLYAMGADTWTPQELGGSLMTGDPTLYSYLNSAWKSMQANVALYPLIAALGVRLAAGIVDMNTGWPEAKNTNLYRAQKLKAALPEVSIGPSSDGGGVQIALTFRY